MPKYARLSLCISSMIGCYYRCLENLVGSGTFMHFFFQRTCMLIVADPLKNKWCRLTTLELVKLQKSLYKFQFFEIILINWQFDPAKIEIPRLSSVLITPFSCICIVEFQVKFQALSSEVAQVIFYSIMDCKKLPPINLHVYWDRTRQIGLAIPFQ